MLKSPAMMCASGQALAHACIAPTSRVRLAPLSTSRWVVQMFSPRPLTITLRCAARHPCAASNRHGDAALTVMRVMNTVFHAA
jgi:hypothetical protein